MSFTGLRDIFVNLWIIGLIGALLFLAYEALPEIWKIFKTLTRQINGFLAGDISHITKDTFRIYALAFVGVVGVLGAFVGYGFSVLRAILNSRQTVATEQGQLTERFTKAVEQLGADKDIYVDHNPETHPNIEVRLGALFALERIAQDSLRDHIPVIETICAYIRENTKEPRPIDEDATKEAKAKKLAEIQEQKPERKRLNAAEAVSCTHRLPPREDIQMALTILGRRSDQRRAFESRKGHRLDLRTTNLQRADLSTLNFGRADFQQARMEGANLREARLEGADLRWARLDATTNLTAATLRGAAVRAVNWKEVKISQEQVDTIFGHTDVILPEGITSPPAWADAPDDIDEFYDACDTWKKQNNYPPYDK